MFRTGQRSPLGLVTGVFLVLFSLSLPAAQEEVFSFYPGSEFTITEKQDLRKRVNGRYEGFVYREMRCHLRESWYGGEPALYSGNVYVLEEMKRNAVSLARRVEESYPLRVGFGYDGAWEMDASLPYPALRGVPAFPEDPVEPGDRWRSFGERVLFSGPESPGSRAQVYCEYRYEGIRGSGEEAYFLISGQYAVRYRGEDPLGDPLLARTDGSHRLEIRIPLADEGRIFMRDTVEEQYTMSDGTGISYSGIILTWFSPPLGGGRGSLRERIASRLGPGEASPEEELPGAGAAVPEGTESEGTIPAGSAGLSPGEQAGGILFSEEPEGLMLTLPDLHFVPDRAEILPEERERLSAIAGILKELPQVNFLVRGHTADVGSAESQQLLSEERAAEVVRQLTALGIAADRFLYEGKGGTRPLGDNRTEEGRKKNRRVEILILE